MVPKIGYWPRIKPSRSFASLSSILRRGLYPPKLLHAKDESRISPQNIATAKMKLSCVHAGALMLALTLVGCQSRFNGTTVSIDNQCRHGFPDELAFRRVIDATLDDRGGTGYAASAVSEVIRANDGMILTYANASLVLPDTATHGADWAEPYLEPTKIAIADDGARGAHNYYAFLQTRPGRSPMWYSFHSTDPENVCKWIPI